MRILIPLTAFLCVMCLLAAPVALAQDDEDEEVDLSWADADSIDVYDESVGDFLDYETDALERAAWEAYGDEDWELAARFYLAYLQYNVSDGGNIYNLACCYGLMGEAELAAMYLDRAVDAGFTDIGHISWDPDFDPVRETDVFSETFDSIVEAAEVEEAKKGEMIYSLAPTFLPCRIMLPEDYDPEENYTLLIGLHGYGASPDSFIQLWERFDDPDFIYISPQAPYPFSVGNDIGYSWDTWHEDNEDFLPQVTTLTEMYVSSLVKSMSEQFNIDSVYLMGFSQGCGYTYMAGIHHHEQFDGLICFGGWLDTDWITDENLEAATDLRVFIAHGTSDRMVEFESGTAARDLLLDKGYDVTFHEFDGAHRVPEEALQAAQAWMNE